MLISIDILLSDKYSIGKNDFKCFVGYKNSLYEVRPVYVKSTKHFEKIQYFTSILEKYESMKVYYISTFKNNFHTVPVHNNKYLKKKVNFYENIVKTGFHDNELPPEKSLCMTQIIVLIIDLVYKNGKHYYSRIFLEECKYRLKEECKYRLKEDTIKRFITEDLTDVDFDSDSESENHHGNNKDQFLLFV